MISAFLAFLLFFFHSSSLSRSVLSFSFLPASFYEKRVPLGEGVLIIGILLPIFPFYRPIPSLWFMFLCMGISRCLYREEGFVRVNTLTEKDYFIWT